MKSFNLIYLILIVGNAVGNCWGASWSRRPSTETKQLGLHMKGPKCGPTQA